MTELVQSSLIILHPKDVFFDWLSSDAIIKLLPNDKQQLISTINQNVLKKNGTLIAIPVMSNESFVGWSKYIRENAQSIMHAELDRWGLADNANIDEPAVRLLKKWFQISHHTHVFRV